MTIETNTPSVPDTFAIKSLVLSLSPRDIPLILVQRLGEKRLGNSRRKKLGICQEENTSALAPAPHYGVCYYDITH